MASKVSGLIEKININSVEHGIASTAYGYCETAADTNPKVVEMLGFELLEGVSIYIKFKENNNIANPKLQIKYGNDTDDITAQIPIVQYGDTPIGITDTTTGWQAGAIINLTYDGTNWVRDQGYNTNVIFYGTCSTAAGTLEKSVIATGFNTENLIPGTIVIVKFETTEASSTTTSGLTLNVNNTGAKPIKFLYNGTYSNLPNRNYLKANQIYQFIYDGTNWVIQLMQNSNSTYYYESMYSDTGADKAAKIGVTSSYVLPETGGHFAFWLRLSNTAASKLTLAVKNGSTAGVAKDIYLNGTITSADNCKWPAGFYIGYYDGTNYHFRTDGKLPGDIAGDAATVNGLTVQTAVPANAVFTDTNKYHKTGSWNGLTYTATAINDADELKFTIPDNYGDTKNPYASKTKNYVLATPSNANGVPSFRKLVAGDIPDLNYLKLDGSNNMTSDINIIAGDTNKFINFWYNTNKTSGASWRTGMWGSGTSDTNYYVIESGTSTTSATEWSRVLQIGQNTYNAGFAGNIYPIINEDNVTVSTKTLGTINNKWAAVYATNLYGNAETASYIKRYYSSTNTDAPVQIRANNVDTYIWQAGHATSATGAFSNNYILQYTGTGATPENYLILKASNNSTITDVVKVDELGNVTFTNTILGTIKHASAAHWSTTSNTLSGVLKIKIKKKVAWMLSFTIRVYQSYKYTDINISGYNYGSSKWYSPKACIIGGTSTSKLTVSFGYDDDAVSNYRTLWVSIPVGNYGGIDIFNVTNGYTQIDITDAFEIIQETTSTGTVQETQDVYRPWYRDEALQAGITTTQYGISYYSDTTGTFASTGAGTSGQYLKSNGSSAPTWESFPSTWTPESHPHGNINNDGTLGNNYRLVWTDSNKKIYAGNHYANATKIAINSTDEPSYNLYVNGTTYFNGNSIVDGTIQTTAINYSDGTTARTMIQFLAGNTYGHTIKIGGGAATVIAAGESISLTPTTTVENLYLLADSTTYVYAHADTLANRIGFAIDTSGHIIPQKAEAANSNQQNLGASNNKWASIFGNTFDGTILKLHQGTAADPSLTSNARIEFDYSSGQPVVISYTPNDSYRNPAGLKIMGGTQATPAWLEVEGSIYADGTSNKGYRVPTTGNSTGSVGGTTTPVYVSNGVITEGTELKDLAYIDKPSSNETTTYLRGDGSWVSLSDMGLSNALHFIGITSTTLSNGSTASTLEAKSTGSLTKTTGFEDGDVVMDGDQLREYVWSGSAWRLLGITTSSAYTYPNTVANNTWISQITQGTDGKITVTTGTLVTSGTWSGTATTATKLSNTSQIGAADRPVYFTNGGVPSATTYRMVATNTTKNTAVAIQSNNGSNELETGIWYVNGTSGILGQSEGAAIINKQSDSWISQIYQDYRTGQIALRGKNNGTWQDWRQVLDSENYSTYLTGTYGIEIIRIPSS